MRKKVIAAVLLFVILLGGCAQLHFLVEVDSIATADSGKRTCVVLPAKKDMVGGDLLFQEFAQYLKRSLSIRGYHEASSPEQAEIAVMLAYGIAGGTAGSVTKVHTDVRGNIEGASTENVIQYVRLIVIRAYDFKRYRDAKEEMQLWQTTIESVGSSDDLRRVFPVLIAASQPYLGTNTTKKIRVTLKEQDDSVLAVKGISGFGQK
jgi:hypothetical protein